MNKQVVSDRNTLCQKASSAREQVSGGVGVVKHVIKPADSAHALPSRSVAGSRKLQCLIAHLSEARAAQKYPRALSLRLAGKPVVALLDSGNTWRSAISEELYNSLPGAPRLKGARVASVGTAKEGGRLQVLGEPVRPLELAIPQAQAVYKFKPIVVRGLSMGLNISGPWMRAHKWDQLHSLGCLRIGKIRVPLNDGTDNCPEDLAAPVTVAYIAETVKVPKGQQVVVLLRSGQPHRGRTGILRGCADFMNKTGLHPGLNALVHEGEDDGLIAALAWNTTDSDVRLRSGQRYGHVNWQVRFSNTDKSIAGVSGIRTKAKQDRYIEDFLKQQEAESRQQDGARRDDYAGWPLAVGDTG